MEHVERAELIRLLVLNEIADDYENVDQVILRRVAESAARFDLEVGRADVVRALDGLVQDGLANGFLLTPTREPPKPLAEMPVLDVVEVDFKTYFYITKKGVQVLKSSEDWPFENDK